MTANAKRDPASPAISVVIPTFQRCGTLRRLFRHLPDALHGVVAIGERLAPNRLQIVYRFVLEYFLALGIERELCGRRNIPPIKARAG